MTLKLVVSWLGRLPLHVNQNNDANNSSSTSGIDLRMTLLPQLLRTQGYRSHLVGKSHIGARSLANLPVNRGFDSNLGCFKARRGR
jgi:arylsulfatase A-like enzyme